MRNFLSLLHNHRYRGVLAVAIARFFPVVALKTVPKGKLRQVMNDITLSVVGNVVNDVDLRFTPSGEAVASFRVASTTRRFDRNNERWIDGDTHYFTVSCWRNKELRSSA